MSETRLPFVAEPAPDPDPAAPRVVAPATGWYRVDGGPAPRPITPPAAAPAPAAPPPGRGRCAPGGSAPAAR